MGIRVIDEVPPDDGGMGHNSLNQQTRNALRAYIERYERLEEEKQAIAGDQKELIQQMKSSGFDVPVIRHVLRRRKMERDERENFDGILETYEFALEG